MGAPPSSPSTPTRRALLAELFAEAGFPPGVFSTGSGASRRVGEWLVAHPDVDHVSFTGSEVTGAAIAKSAAGHLAALIGRADVVVQDLARGAAERLGLSAAALRAGHPELTVCDVSGYAPDGPFAHQRAYDLLIQFNPMHYDDTLARAAGYPAVFSQGMHSAALLASFAADWPGAKNVRRFAVRFREQVWPDDVLTCTGEITAISPNEGGLLVTAELSATRQTGGVAVSASADFLAPLLPLT